MTNRNRTRSRSRLNIEQLDPRLLLDGVGVTSSGAHAALLEQHGPAFVQVQHASAHQTSGEVASEPVTEDGVVDIGVGVLSCVRKPDTRGGYYTSCRRDPATATPGELVSWSIHVMNNPSSATTEATNLEVAVRLPPEVTFTNFVGPDGSYDPSTGIWSKAVAWPAEPISFRLEAVVDDHVAHGTVLELTAELVSVDQQDVDSVPNNDDGDQSEDDESAGVAIVSSFIDLQVTAEADTRWAVPNEPVIWTVQVSNGSNASVRASGITISNMLPETLELVQSTATNGSFDPQEHTWTLVDPLEPGETASLQLTTVPTQGLPAFTKIALRPYVEAADQTDADSTPGNDDANEDDQDYAEVTIDRIVDLEISQTADVSAAGEGDLVNFTLTVTNNAENANYRVPYVQVRHIVSDGLKYLSSTTSGDGLWAQDDGENGTLWTIQSLAVGETITVDLQFEVTGSFGLEQLTSLFEVAESSLEDVDSTPGNFLQYPREDDGTYLEIPVPPQQSISGYAYLDTNNDGVYQEYEIPIRNMEIRLTGNDRFGESVESSTTTDHRGFYQFSGLREGDFQITQIHSPRFLDGIDSVGNLLGSNSVNDRFVVHLTGKAMHYNFGERGIHPAYLSRELVLEGQSLDAALFVSSDENYSVLDAEGNSVTRGIQVPTVAHRIAPVDEQYAIAFANSTAFPSAVGTSARLAVEGSTVLAVGSSGDDILELQLGEKSHTLSLNGIRFEFDATRIDTFHIGGATGDDGIIVLGTDLNDTAHVLGERGEFISSQYSVHTYSIANSTFFGGGGYDYGQLYGSVGDDVFESLPSSSTMLTAQHQMHMAGFDRVDSYGRGGNDLASLYGTRDADQLLATSGSTLLVGPGHRTKIKGFNRVDAYGRGGVDSAWLYGSSGNEQFISTGEYTSLVTADRKNVNKGFEVVRAIAIVGGTDLAYFYDMGGFAELFLLTPQYLLAERLNRVEAIHNYELAFVAGDEE